MGRDRSTFSGLRVLSYGVLATLSFLFLLAPRYAHGQVDEGSITGTILDTTGAVVPNAQVTLLNTDQGIPSETKSSASGGYTFSPVRAGHYTITVTAQGFSKTAQKKLPVKVPPTLGGNAQIKLGPAN